MSAEPPIRSWLEGGPGNPDHATLQRSLTELRQRLHAASEDPSLHRCLGEVLAELGRVEEARSALRRATELAPADAGIWKSLERLEIKAAWWAEVVLAGRQVVALDPTNADSCANICWALRSTGQLEAAVDAGEQAVTIDPENLKARDYLSFAYLVVDDCAAALESCQLGLRIGPRRALSLALMHAALDGLGRRDEAREIADFEQLIWLAPPLRAPSGFATLESFNRALAEAALAAPHRPLDTTQTGNLLGDPIGPLRAFRRIVDDAVQFYVRRLDGLPGHSAHPFARHRPRRWSVEGWANRGTSIAPLEHHIHNQAWLSGVYYPRVPEHFGRPDRGRDGFLEFCRFPQFSARKVESEFVALPPREGMLVLFPSYFYHRISPFSGTEMRLSLAFDVTPTD